MTPSEFATAAMVMRWPEFKAFAARLGIQQTDRLRRVVITLDIKNDIPIAEVELMCIDTTKAVEKEIT